MTTPNTPADVPTVAQVQDHLIATKPQWLSTTPGVLLSITRLASVVHALLTTHTAATRAVNAQLHHELSNLDAELTEARAEVDRLHTELNSEGGGEDQ